MFTLRGRAHSQHKLSKQTELQGFSPENATDPEIHEISRNKESAGARRGADLSESNTGQSCNDAGIPALPLPWAFLRGMPRKELSIHDQ